MKDKQAQGAMLLNGSAACYKKIQSKNDLNFIAFCNELRAYVEEHGLFPPKHTNLLSKNKYTRKNIKAGTLEAMDDACNRSVLMYSLLGACKVLGKNPKRRLTYVLKHIDTTPKECLHFLLPEEWEDN